MTPTLYNRLTELLAQEPRPTGAELRDILARDGHRIGPTTAYRWLRDGIPDRCRAAAQAERRGPRCQRHHRPPLAAQRHPAPL